MKTRGLFFLLIAVSQGLYVLANENCTHSPPPQHIHEEHMQLHQQLHDQAHQNAIDVTNRAHENAMRNHRDFEQGLSKDSRHATFRSQASLFTFSSGSDRLPRRFSLGDAYYASTFRGLTQLMSDLESENPDLHSHMMPSYESIKRKRNAAIVCWGTGAAAGATLIVGGFTFLNRNERLFNENGSFPGSNPKEPNVALIASGAGVMLLGGVIGLLIQPDENDLYNFINLHNRYNPDKKMEWGIGLGMLSRQTPGLTLTLLF